MAETWLTQDAHDRLVEELTRLQGPERAEIVKRVEAARAEGDLRENGGYHAAREALGKLEGRVQQIQALLRDAKVGEAPEDDGTVKPGMVVEALVAGDAMTFLLGSREAAATSDIDVFSEQSPLGAAVLGAAIDEERSYTAPNGRDIAVKVISAKPFNA